MTISLTGFMGCGKSSVGKRLSELLCCRFADLDSVIEERAGRSVQEIFASEGEAEFRRMEKEALKSVLDVDGRVLEIPKAPALVTLGHPLTGGGMSSPSSSTPASIQHKELFSMNTQQMVLALGGGAVMTAGSAEIVHENTFCVYLRSTVDTLLHNLAGETSGRPLLKESGSGTSKSGSITKTSMSAMSSEAETSALRTRIEELMALRASTYEKTAHLIIDTDDKSIDGIATEILSAMTWI